MESVDQLLPFFLEGPDDLPMGFGLSITGHVIIALLLVFGILERIELVEVTTTPIEIVMAPPPEPPRPAGQTSVPPTSAPNEQKPPPGVKAIADVDRLAKAPLGPQDVYGIDQPKQPGKDGTDPSADKAGVPVPAAPDGELAFGGRLNPSQAMVIAPLGPAQPQKTTRKPGKDELTALKEQKIECGIKARASMPTHSEVRQARVVGFATEAQALQMMRSTQATLDRHINSNYTGNQRLFAESLDAHRKFVILLPPRLTANVGDVIEFDPGHIDPLDSCQFIPNLAIRKL